MSQTSFSPDWLTQFSDPYAVLGLSLSSDDTRVLKRYRTVAKILHPDSSSPSLSDRDLAVQLLTRLVNPAYQQLKQGKTRAEVVAALRFRVRQLNGDQPLVPQTEFGRRLSQAPAPQVDVFYEQAVTRLSESQFQPLSNFESVTHQLIELNLIYMLLKIGQPLVQEKRTGIVAATSTYRSELQLKPEETPENAVNYAQRHYQRAQQYGRKGNWAQAIAELRDAVRLEPARGEYHSLLGKAYLMQNLPGMAKVHIRQALKFNPKDPLAVHYAVKLGVPVEIGAASMTPSENGKKPANGGLFSIFARKR
ncbi:tetratricopeptide repeat protein [Leptolyngbya ohadii]|uniref:tetratricopeptide repeat protein n=1 Tax=Leptolyngbya ohadii TaxID=1962290 RepID=UPI000B59DC31|nr:J domain-containing protein [Leptolyngbya ohadii]